MTGNDCSGVLARRTLSSPGPWAAVIWAPFLLAAPAAELWSGPLGWTALPVLAGAFVLAVVTAGNDARRRAHLPDALLVVQALASVVVVPGLQPNSRLWVVVLLSIGVGGAADRRLGMWLVLALAVLAGLAWGLAGGLGDALSVGFPVLVSGAGTFSFYRLYEVIAELRRTREELARLAVRAERLRVSRDLHDVLGHSLSVMVVKAEAVRRLAPQDLDAALVHAADIESIGRQALGDVRRTVTGYRGDGFRVDLDRARDALTAADIRSEVDIDPTVAAPVLADPVLGWVVRESVTNVIRHADAGSCLISLRSEDHQSVLTVVDDGRGPTSRPGRGDDRGHGLVGLAERVAGAGGVLEVLASVGGRGTEVVVRLPSGDRDDAGAPTSGRQDASLDVLG